MLQDKEYDRDLPHKVAKQLDAEYWETSSKSGTIDTSIMCMYMCVCLSVCLCCKMMHKINTVGHYLPG